MESKQLATRYAIFIGGLYLLALGIVLIVRSSLGTTPISSENYVLSLHTPISLGWWTFLTNLLLIGAGFLIIVFGFLLMTGSATEVEFNPDIFSTRRSVVGPMISFFGFLFMVFAIMYKPKKGTEA